MFQNIKVTIPTENIGSIPRPKELIDNINSFKNGMISKEQMDKAYEESIKDTIEKLKKCGCSVVTDGEQLKPSFLTYPISGSAQCEDNGLEITFSDGHKRSVPILSSLIQPPFKYKTYAKEYIDNARKYTDLPIKQSVISVSAMSLLYPSVSINNYSREQFIKDMLNEVERDIRMCLEAGAQTVTIDCTEARLALKLDPSGDLLKQFIKLNDQVLTRFSPEELKRIGIHSCPGADHDSTHSMEVDYCRILLPSLLQLPVGKFYLEFAAESNKQDIILCISKNIRPEQIIFFGVTNVNDPRIETPEEIRDMLLEIYKYIPIEQFGSCDDCGFSPFFDDLSTSRDIAFAKIDARIKGTKLAEEIINKHLNE
ncbi:hypothetical protein DLAC_00077 [Tieghemostelium lacteum]|uniref:Cobalamin-independent methionine synthase MetE C-terminal/archaeal domain-containing protein n=1 Tax=Tieghemostelium lacteum TaxID=361077 RepID=A0A152A8Q9_TIELA|nr:hypothetical protein DLAC_00077 [Tieghemostelium lacteum]|eukprot:KYR02628.1 hypothetical protein DLAC_00077 [Tieghemostelium lacteum]